MRNETRSSFFLPFALGTIFGALGGATLCALLGRRVFTSLVYLWSVMTRETDEEPRFDLFLQ